MVLACLAACHKDKEMDVKEAVVSNEEMTVSGTQVCFSWQVDFAGQFQTGVEVSQNESMTDLRRVEASKQEDKFVAVVDSLTEGKKYYYRIVVWNKFGSYEEMVKDFTTAKTFSIHVEASEGGTAAGGGTFAEGDTCTVVAAANVGYNFVNWTENGSQVSAEAEYSFAVTGNRNLLANFTSQEYTITATADPIEGGTVNGSGGYNNGDECTLTATPNEGYEFLNWTKEDGTIVSTDPVYAFTVTETAAFVAHFQIRSFTVTVSAHPNNGGSVYVGYSPGATQGTFNSGQYCTVHAIANSGYRFANWTENDSVVANYATYDFRVTSDRNLVANFTRVYTISVSANPTNGGTVTGSGLYEEGETCRVTATANPNFTFVNWMDGSQVASTQAEYTFTVTGDRTLVAHFEAQPQAPTGAINGKFTINSSGAKVYFSNGNLQYIGSANTPYWKFADNQWDYLGTTTGQNSTSQTVDRDLFGWGTSGWDSGNTYYHPWDTDNSDGSLYGPPGQYNLTGSYAQADWGEYNSIYSGSTATNGWRTLTREEWAYVFQGRSGATSKYGHGKVNGQNGMILLPDEWTLPSGMSFTPGNSSWVNEYTTGQWEQMEQNGAVFLPAAGNRYGTSVFIVGSYGIYWSASYSYSGRACHVSFLDSDLDPQYSNGRCYGFSVRLVRVAQ